MRTTLIALLAVACSLPTHHRAEVAIEVEGQSLDYSTSLAEWERDGGGPLSIYLLRADKDAGPWVNLRYYTGNPVGHFWIRYQSEGDSEPSKWECFVPGVLSTGQETLTWPKSNGEARHKTETGEASCKVEVVEEEGRFVLTWDAVLAKVVKKKKHGADGEQVPAETITSKGRAVLTL